jgi:hypothetical protein
MADIDELKPSDAYSYFKETIFPFGVSRYQLSQNNVSSASSGGSSEKFQEPMIINVLIQCIRVYKISIKKVNFFDFT